MISDNYSLEKIMKSILLTLSICALLLPIMTWAEGKHDDAIKARQALMQVYRFDWGILGDMAKGKTDYDSVAAGIAAHNLLTALKIKQDYMWPEGSDSETAGNTENWTLPALWTTDSDKVAEADKKMLDAAVKMNNVAATGLSELKSAMIDINNGCKGCHDDYRKKKK